MDMLNLSSVTASKARSDFYNLVRSAGKGLRAYEISLRGSEPVIMMSKEELESWMETLDVMSNPEEVEAIEAGRKDKKSYSHKQVVKELGLEDEVKV